LKPWQPNITKGETEDDCEDPERLVLFDDISSYLFKLENDENKFKLLLYFLELLGIQMSPNSSSQSFETQRYFELSIQAAEQLIKQAEFYSQGIGWQRCDYWHSEEEGMASDICPTQEALVFARNTILKSLSLFEDNHRDYLMTTWLLFEFHLSQMQESEKKRRQTFKEVYKLAKGLLKEPSNR
jgi:hypothetical protein